ncbi:lyase [Caulobacter sp. D4A]|uniref:lyase n=1 Tax=unclassified Caulobacter TaxID=2648921 RepID=UPI000D73AE3C|nr:MULTISPECIES: lyase [unclassified Caulobacter]PXA83288.1 lyase [Caulobacter sp. D4A]PXA91792.1 lyase [Caulobacter sp. D5]
MREAYEPASDFLKAVIAETAPLLGDATAEENLRRVVDLTGDADASNRDWAVFLLAQAEIDTPAVREALLQAARHDDDDVVRAEAMLGLAQRDPGLALPLVREALAGGAAALPLFEAATLCAHPSLIADLKVWAEPSDEPYIDQLAAEALAACEAAA